MFTSRSSALLLFSLRKLEVNQDFNERKQLVREAGGRVESALVEMQSWVSSAYQ